MLELSDIHQAFSGAVVLRSVSFELQGSQLVGIYGPNGAGKSTLLKILAGLIRPQKGAVELDGSPLNLGSPKASRQAGMRYISQNLSLIPSWTVREQLLFENGPTGLENSANMLKSLGFKRTLDSKIKSLSVEESQLVEIAKALGNKSKVLLVDEPTSGLDFAQRECLYKKLTELARDGALVLIVSHDLAKLKSYCDSFIKVADHRATMLPELSVETASEASHTSDRHRATNNVSVVIAGSEVVAFPKGSVTGITGTLKSGVQDILRVMYGLANSDAMIFLGEDTWPTSLAESAKKNVRYVSRDRIQEWGFPELPIWFTIAARMGFGRPFDLKNNRQFIETAKSILLEADVRPNDPDKLFGHFSGGNQQKAIVASEIASGPVLLLLDEPISGIDADARRWLASALKAYAKRGGTALLYSQECEDLHKICDFVLEPSQFFGKESAIEFS